MPAPLSTATLAELRHSISFAAMEQQPGYRFTNNQRYLLLAVVIFLLFFKLGSPPIYILDEARNAQAGREMFQKQDWIVPTFNGELRSHKPILHYWFMQPAFAVFGETSFAARFSSALMGILTILVAFCYTRRLFSETVAFCTALALALSTHFLFEFRLAVPDPYLIFFSTLATFAAFTYLQTAVRWQLYLAAAAFALATLAKGPVAVGLPGIALLIWVIWKKQWKRVFDYSMIIAAIIFLAVALPWYIAVHHATDGQWTREFFFEHNFNRFSEEMEGHGGIFLITIAIVVIGMLPFTSFLGEVVKQRRSVFAHPLVQFSALVTLVFTLFYSVSSTKLPNYPMPCYPFFAVVLGAFIALLIDNRITSLQYPKWILLLIITAIPIGGYFAIQQETEASHLAWVALTLLVAPVMYLAFMLTNRQSGWPKQITWLAISYTFFNAIFLHVMYPALYSQDPVSKTIHLLKHQPQIISYKVFNPAYRFHLGQNIPVFSTTESLQQHLLAYPDAHVITRAEYLSDLESLHLAVIASHHDIFELPTTVILKRHAVNP